MLRTMALVWKLDYFAQKTQVSDFGHLVTNDLYLYDSQQSQFDRI